MLKNEQYWIITIGLKNIKIFKDAINKRCPIIIFSQINHLVFLQKKKKTEKTQFWKQKTKHSILSAALTQLTLYTKQ